MVFAALANLGHAAGTNRVDPFVFPRAISTCLGLPALISAIPLPEAARVMRAKESARKYCIRTRATTKLRCKELRTKSSSASNEHCKFVKGADP